MSNVTVREKEAREIVGQKTRIIETIVGTKAKASVFASSLVAMANDYNLKDCDVSSVLDVGLQIVQAGLNPNKLFGQAYVVPFKLKSGRTMAQLQIGYKGWISLGYRNGWTFKAVPVYKCDDFSIEFGGFEDVIHFKPDYEQREDDSGQWVFKNLVGVIVYAKDKNGEVFTEFVSFKKLEKIRLKSQNQSNGELKHIWLEWAEEMYKAKAIKYVITRLPINDEIMEVAVAENEPYTQETMPMDNAKQETKNLNYIDAKVEKQDLAARLISEKKCPPMKTKKRVKELTDEQQEQYLNDQGAFDSLAEEIKNEA